MMSKEDAIALSLIKLKHAQKLIEQARDIKINMNMITDCELSNYIKVVADIEELIESMREYEE